MELLNFKKQAIEEESPNRHLLNFSKGFCFPFCFSLRTPQSKVCSNPNWYRALMNQSPLRISTPSGNPSAWWIPSRPLGDVGQEIILQARRIQCPISQYIHPAHALGGSYGVSSKTLLIGPWMGLTFQQNVCLVYHLESLLSTLLRLVGYVIYRKDLNKYIDKSEFDSRAEASVRQKWNHGKYSQNPVQLFAVMFSVQF